MKRFISIFRDSAKELTDIRCIVVTGMLIAVHVLLGIFIMIPVGEYIKISFSFLALAAIGMLFGPVPAAMAGAVTDILGFLLANKTGGAYHPGFTLVQITGGLIYGIILYKAEMNKFFSVKCAVSKLCIVIICNLTLNSYFLSVLYGQSFWGLMPARLLKNAIQLPIDVILMSIVLPTVYVIYKRVFGEKKALAK